MLRVRGRAILRLLRGAGESQQFFFLRSPMQEEAGLVQKLGEL